MEELSLILFKTKIPNRSVEEYLNYELQFQFNNLDQTPNERIIGMLSCQQEGSEHKHSDFDEPDPNNIVADVVGLKM